MMRQLLAALIGAGTLFRPFEALFDALIVIINYKSNNFKFPFGIQKNNNNALNPLTHKSTRFIDYIKEFT